jgi:hypothetical protein
MEWETGFNVNSQSSLRDGRGSVMTTKPFLYWHEAADKQTLLLNFLAEFSPTRNDNPRLLTKEPAWPAIPKNLPRNDMLISDIF